MISVVRYEAKYKSPWDEFITNSKNGVFLFYRDYMEYHSDRFTDHSIMFFDENRLIALMPANITEDILFSHGGLTFGGIISAYKMKTPLMCEIFKGLREYLEVQGIMKIVYKTIPYIYHDVPAEEDLYALFLHNAKLERRDVSSTIFMKEKMAYSKGRKWAVKKSKSTGLDVRRSHDFKSFMDIEEENLRNKYGIKPTHSTAEMELLANKFPDNIKLFAAYKGDNMVGGVIVYENTTVAHTQYIASTDEGKKLFAGDLLLDFLINRQYVEKRYFDFGISTEKEGRFLNIGLIIQKEEFGASAVVYDTYELELY